jgi:hypothetical protein
MNGTIADGVRLALAGAALMGAAPEAASAAELQGSFPIVELRQYTLHDGKRDALIDLFEREFVESQEALGMKVIGTFTDIDRPNRFVWLRGFRDMDSRLAGLSAFYGGPVWQAHRSEANATMVDSDNVLLLHAPDHAAEFRAAAHSSGTRYRGARRPRCRHHLLSEGRPRRRAFHIRKSGEARARESGGPPTCLVRSGKRREQLPAASGA